MVISIQHKRLSKKIGSLYVSIRIKTPFSFFFFVFRLMPTINLKGVSGMSMNADEKGAYIRCCNFLIEMLMKYGTDGEEDDNPRSQTKEGGDFRPHLFIN